MVGFVIADTYNELQQCRNTSVLVQMTIDSFLDFYTLLSPI